MSARREAPTSETTSADAEAPDAMSRDEVRALAHELEVHQAEIELQNEELRRSSLALEEARDRYRDLFEFAPCGYLTLDTNGTILEGNLKAGELLGHERARIIGRRLQEFVGSQSQDAVHLHLHAMLVDREAPACEVVVERRQGPLHLAIESTQLAGDRATIRAILADISDRVRTEDAVRADRASLERTVVTRTSQLRRSERLTEKIADAAPMLIWIYDLDTQATVYSNAFARATLGTKAGSAEARDLVSDPASPGLREAIESLAADRSTDPYELHSDVSSAHGRPLWLHSRLTVFTRETDGRVTQVLGISQDVTELRLAEESIRRLAHEAAIAAERERREISALLHDSVGQLLPLANTRLAIAAKAADPEMREQLRGVERLLREAHQAATSLSYRLGPPALREIGLVVALRGLAREMARDHGLDVEVHAVDSERTPSDAIAFALYRVVHELLVNIAKHSGAGKATVDIAHRDSEFEILVEDRGRGFDPDAQRTNGFGLRSARERLDYLGAHMWIDSAPRGGTRVRLVAPLRAAAEGAPR